MTATQIGGEQPDSDIHDMFDYSLAGRIINSVYYARTEMVSTPVYGDQPSQSTVKLYSDYFSVNFCNRTACSNRLY